MYSKKMKAKHMKEDVNEISRFPEMLYERGGLKNFSNFTDKHEKQSSGGISKDYKYLKTFLKILRNSLIDIFAGVSFLIKLQARNLKLSEAATGVFCKLVAFKKAHWCFRTNRS